MSENIKYILGILTAIISVTGTVIAIIWYRKKKELELIEKDKEISDLRKEINQKNNKENFINEILLKEGDLIDKQINAEKVLVLTRQLEEAVGASFHSISIPVKDKSELQIQFSTEPESKVIGLTFPINSGVAGWVFKTKRPKILGESDSSEHFNNKVDKTVGSKTGKGSMLVFPLLIAEECIGILQFMHNEPNKFHEKDIDVAKDLIPKITRSLFDIIEKQKMFLNIDVISREESTVMFTDIIDFSSIINLISLDDYVTMLNQYYEQMISIAIKYNGVLKEYLGDGLYIHFPNNMSLAHSAFRALECSIEMQNQYNNLLTNWIKFQLPISLKNAHCIGISTSQLSVVQMGHPSLRTEKIVGKAVNEAAHICILAKENNGGIFISNRSYEFSDKYSEKFKSISSKKHSSCWQFLAAG
jgi:class 3 adenylate cyclase